MNQLTYKKNYLYTLSSGFGGMVLSSLVSFIVIPISLNYWKTEKFGIWALITSVLIYLNMSNLGLNTAASVLIAKNSNVKDKFKILNRARNLIVISVLTAILCFIILNLYYTNWIYLLGRIPNSLRVETLRASFILIIFYLLNLPFSLLTSVFYGFQKVYIDNVFSFISTLGSLVSLLTVIIIKGSLISFAAMTGAVTLCINIGKFGYFYFFIYRENQKSLIASTCDDKNDRNIETSYKHILLSGVRFFIIGIAGMVVWNTDNFVISHLLGVKEVTPYAITFKIYYILFSVMAMLSNAYLPLMSRELGSGNWEWINNIYAKFLVVVAVIGGMIWLGGILFFRDVIALWAGKEGFAGLLTVFALGGYSYLFGMTNLNGGVFFALNYTQGIPSVGWLEAFLKISLSVVLLRWMGIGGVAMGTFAGSLLSATWILPYLVIKRTNHRIQYRLDFIAKHFIFAVLPFIIIGIVVQIAIQSTVLRLIIGFFTLSAYGIVSYLIIPKDVKAYFLGIIEYIRQSRQFRALTGPFIRKHHP